MLKLEYLEIIHCYLVLHECPGAWEDHPGGNSPTNYWFRIVDQDMGISEVGSTFSERAWISRCGWSWSWAGSWCGWLLVGLDIEWLGRHEADWWRFPNTSSGQPITIKWSICKCYGTLSDLVASQSFEIKLVTNMCKPGIRTSVSWWRFSRMRNSPWQNFLVQSRV
jgi:hypothetical protein